MMPAAKEAALPVSNKGAENALFTAIMVDNMVEPCPIYYNPTAISF